jgi:hypothetical protein
LSDPEWKERVKAAAEGRSPAIVRQAMEPYTLTLHETTDVRYVIELRPRAGTWWPSFAAVPIEEKEALDPSILRATRGVVPTGGVLLM